ncbi:MAG: NRDE family protein [Burkholderiales bacterium]
MCLIVLAWQTHPAYALALVGNRDEYHARPTLPAAYWPDHPEILAGRDLKAGGTWLGVTRQGRFAAITNYRDPAQFEQQRRSRGELTQAFLLDSASPKAWLERLKPRLSDYNDFNLLVGDTHELCCLESRTGTIIPLHPGVYGLSNHLLDTPWPKVSAAKARLVTLLDDTGAAPAPEHMAPLATRLMALMNDATPYPDALLPDTGIPLARERLISAAFILDPDYGTRSTSVLLRRHDGLSWFAERSFNPDGGVTGECGIMPSPLEPLA